jgi:hypothetical protein
MEKIYPFISGAITQETCRGRKPGRTREEFIARGRVVYLSLILGLLLINANELGAQITQRGSATTATGITTITINKPTGVVAGDVMIVNIVQNETNNATLSDANLTEWTLIDGRLIYDSGTYGTSNAWWGTVLYKVATGSEGSNYAFSCDADADMSIGSIVAFYNVDATGGYNADGTVGGPFDVDPGTLRTNNSNPVTADAITTSSANAAVIMLAQVAAQRNFGTWSTTSPGTLTELYDYNTTDVDDASVGAAWAIKASAGSTGNGTVSLGGTSNYRNAGILIALRSQPIISITTGAVSTPPFCVSSESGASGTVAFTSSGTFTNATFTAYLSDASGSFSSPTSIGSTTVNGTDPSGSIDIGIPTGTATGTGYRIRIDCASPAITGTESSAIIIINGAADVTSAAASAGNEQAILSWTNPSGCFNEIMIVAKAGSATTSFPGGDGSSYTANTVFATPGTEFGSDGGFVVYKGSTSPQTVTGLTNGTTYHFTFFTRNGSAWSSGTTVTAIPSLATSGDYRSNATIMNWNTTTSGQWQRFNGSTWVNTTTPPTSANANIITIRDGNTVTVTAVFSVDQVIVASGGKVTVNNVTMTIAQGTGDDFVVNGTVELTGASGVITTTGTLVFNSESNYIHNRATGIIPTANWDIGSTCSVIGANGLPTGGMNQSFGNFIWDCPNQNAHSGTWNIGVGMEVKRDLTVIATGSGTTYDIGFTQVTDGASLRIGRDLILSGGIFRVCYLANASVTVGRDLIINGGTLVMNSSENTTTPDYVGTLIVEGDVSITSGTLNFSQLDRCDEGDNGIINVKGDFTHSGGTITELGGSSGNTINFSGTTIQNYTSGGTVANTVNFNVNNGAILYTGASLLGNGSIGTFTLADGGTLGIGDAAGITTSGTTGNIRVTGTRTYNTGANYIYNGSAAQVTGTGLPATVNSLTFNNTVGAITFTAACAVTNDFSITAGSKANLGTLLSHSAGTLILGGNPQIGCSYGSSASDATVKNDTYFENSGIVTTGTCPNGLWIGVGSTNWHTAANWLLGGQIPTSSDDVIISSAAPYQPVVLATNTASCKNLTINNGATLTILPLGQATIAETLNNNGTLNLESDATGSASLIVNTYSGNPANIKLYLTGENWHYISSPVLGINETTFFDNTDGTWDLAHFKEDISLSLFPSQTQYNWQMSWVGYDGWSYFDESSTGFSSTPMVIGKGYNFWDENTTIYTLTGSINTQQISQPITVTDRGVGNEGFQGFNLLGNPFSCGLNINTMFSSGWPASTYTAVYFTSNGQPLVYSTDIMVPGDAIPGFIPPMQGFFIKTDAAGTFTFPLGARVHTSVNHYKKGGDETLISLVRLSISENGKKDETVIRFDKSAKTGADYNFDAPRFIQPQDKPGIYTSINGQDFTINGMPFPESSVEIPVTVELLAAGNHVITAMEIQELANYKVSLKDKSTGSTVDLNSVKEYSFSAPAGEIKDRFILAITNLSTDIEDPLAAEKLFNIYHGFGLINIQPLSDEWNGVSGSVKIMDLSGKPVRVEPNAEFNKNTLIQLPAPDKAGLYFVEIRSGMMKFTGKVLVK